MSNDELGQPFIKVGDTVIYDAPDEWSDNDGKVGTVTAVLRRDSIVVEWEDGEISTVSENFLDLV